MCRFYSKGKNGRKRFTVLFENVFGIFFSPFCVIFWRVFAKVKVIKNQSQPKLFPQVGVLGKRSSLSAPIARLTFSLLAPSRYPYTPSYCHEVAYVRVRCIFVTKSHRTRVLLAFSPGLLMPMIMKLQ